MCLLALTAPLPAPAAPSGEPFTLSRAVAEALRNNGELLALRDELGIAEAEAGRAGLHPDPVLEFGLDTGKFTGSDGEERFSAGISREFLTFGKKRLRGTVAGKVSDAARERVRNAERLLALDVKERFHGLTLAREQMELARKAVALDRELARVAEERFLAGDIAEIEVSLARMEEHRTRQRVIAAEAAVAAQRAGLAQSLGLPAGTVLEIAAAPAGKLAALDPSVLAEQALRQRPDLIALALEQESTDATVELARAERWPNVTAGIVYSHERSSEGDGSLEERTTDELLGFRLSVPFPSPARREALLREATARQNGAARRLAAQCAAIIREIEVATARLAAAEDALRLYQSDMLPRQEENLHTVREAYRLGEVGILNVIEEQRRHSQVNSDYLTALHGRDIAVAQLEAAAGIELAREEGDHR